MKEVRPSSAKMKMDMHKIKTMENQLDKALVKYSDFQAQNKKLRGEIDVMRRQMKKQKYVNDGYNREIKNVAENCKKMNSQIMVRQSHSEETNNQILALKAKHEHDKLVFEMKIMELQKKLKERDENEKGKTMKGEDVAVAIGGGAEAFSNPIELLKRRLNKWLTNNKEKKDLMDMYVRNVKIIEDAFEQIKEQTGIASNEEIVTTFCKSEEQNNSLINYINNLNSDIDVIEEQNKHIEAEIKRHEELGQLSEKEKRTLKQKLRQEINDIKSSTLTKEAQIKEVENQMVEIKDFVQTMVANFQESDFNLAVTSPMQYHEDVQFNENNVTLYLSELEEYISTFITFLAQRNKTSYPSI